MAFPLPTPFEVVHSLHPLVFYIVFPPQPLAFLGCMPLLVLVDLVGLPPFVSADSPIVLFPLVAHLVVEAGYQFLSWVMLEGKWMLLMLRSCNGDC